MGDNMGLRKKKNLSPLEKAVDNLQTGINRWNKKRKHWKRRFYLMVVCPVVLVAMIIKAVKTYVRIKLMEIGMKAPSPLEKEKE